MLKSNALTTLIQAKEFLKIPLAELSQDGLIELLINSASETLERETNRVLAAVDLVEFQDGRRQNSISLNEYPVISVSELKTDPYNAFPASTIIPADDYFFDDDGITLKNSVFSKGFKNIKISYRAGFEVIPSDIELACLWLVFWQNRIRQSDDIGRNNKSKDGESTSYSQTMPQDVRDCIDRYKRLECIVDNRSVRNI